MKRRLLALLLVLCMVLAMLPAVGAEETTEESGSHLYFRYASYNSGWYEDEADALSAPELQSGVEVKVYPYYGTAEEQKRVVSIEPADSASYVNTSEDLNDGRTGNCPAECSGGGG